LADEIELAFEVPQPSVWRDDNGFTHVSLPEYRSMAEPGHPALPVRSVQVLLPEGHRLTGVTFVAPQPLEIPGNHFVLPAQREYPPSYRGLRPFTLPDRGVYSAPGRIPVSVERALPVQIKHGFSILPLQIRPVIYRPAEGRLEYVPAFTLIVQTESAGPAVERRGLESDFESVGRLVANPGMLERYPRSLRTAKNDRRYVVVTSAELAACEGEYSLSALLDEKVSRGVTTHIQTMQDIRAAYSEGDDAQKVRDFIRDMYTQHGTEYVLLAGDADLEVVGGETQAPHVPVRGLWGEIGLGGTDRHVLFQPGRRLRRRPGRDLRGAHR
jgi:hypothetical protein